MREGVLGRAYFAQSWYTNNRPSIGIGTVCDPPKTLDYTLWQGPAPALPYHSNYLHYNWHWFWNWGNGELGNNGIHMIDLCRWGLAVDYPTRVVSSGGRYRYNDDQQTPDTHTVAFEFPGNKSLTWEGLSCNQFPDGQKADVIFYGDKGSLRIVGSGYSIHDPKGKEIEKNSGEGGDLTHITNFLDAIRGTQKLHSEIGEGHKSTLLCHLGNISHRVGHTLHCNADDGAIRGDATAAAFWKRTYTQGWEPSLT